MNSNSPTRCLAPLFLLFFIASFLPSQVRAQNICTLNYQSANHSTAKPPVFTAAIDSSTGTFILSGSVISQFFTSDCPIDQNSGRFFGDTLAATTLGSVITLNCNQTGQTLTYWFAVRSQSSNYNEASESRRLKIEVQVRDFSAPEVTFQNVVINETVNPNTCFKVVSFTRPNKLNTTATDCNQPIVWEEQTAVVNGVPDPTFLEDIPPYNPDGPQTTDMLEFPAGVTVLTYAWKDKSGNTAKRTITVVVNESVPPAASCKANPANLALDASGKAVLSPTLIDNGSTDNCGTPKLSVSKSQFDCNELGAFVITLTATDYSGNTASCTTTINVVDNLAPAVICPTQQSLPAGAACTATLNGVFTPGTPPLQPVQYSDNCTVSFAYQLNGTGPFTLFNGDLSQLPAFALGTTQVTIRVSETNTLNANQPAGCTFAVNVSDLQPPVFQSGQAFGSTVTGIMTNGECTGKTIWTLPSYIDNCSTVTLNAQTAFPGVTVFNQGITPVQYTFRDAASNTIAHTFNIKINDNQPPVAKCKNISLQLGPDGQAVLQPAQVDDSSTDNCGYTYDSAPATYNCTHLGQPQTYNLVIKDKGDGSNSNKSNCNAQVTVTDPIAPTAICNPLLDTLLLTANGNAVLRAVQLGLPSTDNGQQCALKSYKLDLSPNGAFTTDSLTFNCTDPGQQFNVYLRVTDASNNEHTSGCPVQIVDLIKPTLNIPANVTVECDAYAADPGAYGLPTASDNCGLQAPPVLLPNVIIQPGSCPVTYVRTWQVTDVNGNTATATQTIKVNDTTKPVFSQLFSTAVSLETPSVSVCTAMHTLAVKKSSADLADNCTPFESLSLGYTIVYPPGAGLSSAAGNLAYDAAKQQYLLPVSTFPIGLTRVTFTAGDACGNKQSVTVNITVADKKAPEFSNSYKTNVCKTYNLNASPGGCENLLLWNRPLPNNMSDCQIMEVREIISNPSVEEYVNTVNQFTWPVTTPQVFALFPVGITTVTYEVKDSSGNIGSCVLTINVKDNQPPTIVSTPVNQTLAATCPDALIPDYRPGVLVNDNCPASVVITQTPAPGVTLSTALNDPAPMAGDTFTVTMTVADANPANTKTKQFKVTLTDGDKPIPNIIPLPDLIDSCGSIVVLAPSATDPCSPGNPIIYGTPSVPVDTIFPTNPPSYRLKPGSYVVSWLYDDGVNVTTQIQNIILFPDTFPPVAKCKPNFTLPLPPSGLLTLTTGMIDNGSKDPNDCGSVTLSLNKSIYTCANLGANTVTLTVTDNAKYKATCQTIVTIQDTIRPILSQIPAGIKVAACAIIPSAGNPDVDDNCDVLPTITLSETSTQTQSGAGQYNYTITRTWVAQDKSGNTSSASQVIEVADTQAPVFLSSMPDSVELITTPARKTCDEVFSFNLLSYINDCAPDNQLTVVNSQNNKGADLNGIYSVGSHKFVITVTDPAGNTSKDSLVLVVRDGTNPAPLCRNLITADLLPSGSVTVQAAQFNEASTDNCTPAGQLKFRVQRTTPDVGPEADALSFTCDDADGITQHGIRLIVLDAAGNQSTCESAIIIQDLVNPQITACPTGKTVSCSVDLSPVSQGSPSIQDNCPNQLKLDFDDQVANAPLGSIACYSLERTWIARDLAGNTSTCKQVFEVIDTIAPVLSSYLPNDTVSCEEGIEPPFNVIALDNCLDTVNVVLTIDTFNIAPGACGKYSFTVSRKRVAVDDCGNTETYERLITMVDNQPPQFLGLPDTIVINSSNFPTSANCTVPVNFDISQNIYDCSAIDEMVITNNSIFGNQSTSINGQYAIGDYAILFTATDACGNYGEKEIVIRVVDNTPPAVTCKTGVSVSLDPNGSANLFPFQIEQSSSDNCGIGTKAISQGLFDCGDLGPKVITLTVTDVNGNAASCTATVTVTAPSGVGPVLNAAGTPETHFGADNGSAQVSVTSGGSGSYSYKWSNGATTASVSNLTAGTYSVTVIDQQTGCQAVDTAIVQPGPKLMLTIGKVAGAQGEIVKVPVTVQHFIDMRSFSFTLQLPNTAVGTIVGLSDINPALNGLVGIPQGAGILKVEWLLNPKKTLPNGTILFTLSVKLSSTAPVGTTSPVNFTTTAITFSQDSSGKVVTVPMVSLQNGEVSINAITSNERKVAGTVLLWANPEVPNSVEKPVANVTVKTQGTNVLQQLTAANGEFSFTLPLQANVVIKASKDAPNNNGVSGLDLQRLSNHLFGFLLPSPYQWVAADVNADNKVSLVDFLRIQSVILGTPDFPNQPDWRFIPKNYVFPSNTAVNGSLVGPLSLPYPDSFSHQNLANDILDDHFIAVRLGDVNGSAPLTQAPVSQNRQTDYFVVDDRAAAMDEVLTVPVLARNFSDRLGYQATFSYDVNALELMDIVPGTLPGLTLDNFGTAYLQDGHLTTVWVSAMPYTLADNAWLFSLRFKVRKSVSSLSEALWINSAITPAESYNRSGEVEMLDLAYRRSADQNFEEPFALYQNRPNPFQDATVVGFRLPKAGKAVLRVYSATGKLVYIREIEGRSGYSEIQLTEKELGAPGVYWYELEAGSHQERRKLILLD